MQLHMGMCPRQRGHAVPRSHVVVFVGQVLNRLARGGGQGGERHVFGGTRCNVNPCAQAEYRIEHIADRVGQGAAIHHRNWVSQRLSAPDKAGPVGLVLKPVAVLARGHHMSYPDCRVAGLTRVSLRDKAAHFGQILGLDKQVGKGGMRNIRRKGGKYDLSIRGDFDFPRMYSVIGQTQATDFRIVHGRDDNFQGARNAAVRAGDADAVFDKDRLVVVGNLYRRLITGGPHLTSCHIA